MYRIKTDKLNELYDLIASKMEMLAPINAGNQVNFKRYESGMEVDLTKLKSVKSPKDAFFPQCESLYSCGNEGKKITITPAARKDENFVVFGMKACDVRAVAVLDKVFLAEPVDSFYAARRAHGTIVAISCNEPEESCFCKAFGIDMTNPEGDVNATIVDEYMYFTPMNEKGEVFIANISEMLEDANKCGDIVDGAKVKVKEIANQLPYMNLSLEGWNGDVLSEKFDSPIWEELYKPCLACGTCTFVCPTCQCYDIKDFNTGHSVERYRCWDSCMYSDFTMMAHGNNRTSQMQRFRQRFMHKLVYFPANNDGMYSCVGCGRCVDKCPSMLNIVKVIKAFEKDSLNSKGGTNE